MRRRKLRIGFARTRDNSSTQSSAQSLPSLSNHDGFRLVRRPQWFSGGDSRAWNPCCNGWTALSPFNSLVPGFEILSQVLRWAFGHFHGVWGWVECDPRSGYHPLQGSRAKLLRSSAAFLVRAPRVLSPVTGWRATGEDTIWGLLSFSWLSLPRPSLAPLALDFLTLAVCPHVSCRGIQIDIKLFGQKRQPLFYSTCANGCSQPQSLCCCFQGFS